MPKGSLYAARSGALVAALALACVPAAAQTAPGLTLDQVVRRATTGNRQMQIARARVDGVQGRAVAASAPFDTHLGATVGGEQKSAYLATTSGLSSSVRHTTEYTLQASRQLRSGIVLQPQVSVQRVTEEGLPVVDAASAVSLGVAVPLMRDRLGRASGAGERAMRLRVDAGRHDVRFATEAGVASAAQAYWEYAAAYARLDVYREAEARAERRLEETRVLVRGDERPAADLNPLQAALARARQQRIAAEQGVDESRNQLGIVLGLDIQATAALPAPATAFPVAEAWAPGAAEQERLVALALGHRGDLRGTELQLASDGIALQGAREALKPRLDLRVSVGYTGRQLGSGYGGLVQPLYRDVPGMNGALSLEYQFPVARSEARGLAAQNEAARAERQIGMDDLARQIAGGVFVSMQQVTRGAAALAEADRAVAMYRTTVDDEQQKNRLGVSTLFDVTYAEDNLTSAQLAAVSGRLAYARALAQLRVVTGTLAEETDGGLAVDPARLVTRP